jgi:hypothetical protein
VRLSTTIGRRGEGTSRSAPSDALAATRVEQARRCRSWSEIANGVLVQRERGILVNVETDEAFQVYRGDAFSRAGEVVSDMTPLRFVVRDGDVLMLERLPQTWSEIVYQRARAGAR